MRTQDVTITENQIVMDRQAVLDIVRALDIGVKSDRLPMALDKLREPFFADEISSGTARKGFALNSY